MPVVIIYIAMLRSSHMPLPVILVSCPRFLDDACKTVKVDETKPVSEIVQDICCQLEVQNSVSTPE